MKTKVLISFAVTAKLICAFVFACADCLFSHVVAHFQNVWFSDLFQTYFPEASSNIARDGYMGDFLLLTYRKPTHDRDLAVSVIDAWRGAGRNQFELESFPLLEGNVTILDENDDLDEFMRSDHVALWRDNIPAISISDSGTKCGLICYLVFTWQTGTNRCACRLA